MDRLTLAVPKKITLLYWPNHVGGGGDGGAGVSVGDGGVVVVPGVPGVVVVPGVPGMTVVPGVPGAGLTALWANTRSGTFMDIKTGAVQATFFIAPRRVTSLAESFSWPVVDVMSPDFGDWSWSVFFTTRLLEGAKIAGKVFEPCWCGV